MVLSPGQVGPRVAAIFGVGMLLLITLHIYSSTPAATDAEMKLGTFIRPAVGNSLKNIDPLLAKTEEPVVPGKLYGPGERPLANATLLSLVRNNELEDMLGSMRDLERTFNRKFKYPWTFINDVPFSDEFIKKTTAEASGEVFYEVIPKEHWEFPSWINEELFTESAQLLKEQKVQYSAMRSYHQMCRWNSGFFYKHPALLKRKWYWRVEPKVNFYCDINYDVFHYMEDNNKTYGFVINIYDSPESIAGLWKATKEFMEEHPEYIAENNAYNWLVDSKKRPDHNRIAGGYSTCHFWSNFEIGDMDFWRSKPYEDYFDHLDRSGGFFYERWGDAPVHSVALGLMLDKTKIHWFKDIGYRHAPYFNCPNSPRCHKCKAGTFTYGEDVEQEDCRSTWFEVAGIEPEWLPTTEKSK